MAIHIASGYIDDLRSDTTHTLAVGFRPKAGIFWTTVVNASNFYSSSHPASVGYWQNNNGTSVYACHAMFRTDSSFSSDYAATYTDCVAAAIGLSSRYAHITVSSISSTGITLSRSGSSTVDRWRLHWILFGGDVVAKVGTVTTPNGSAWNPVTVPGAGFDVLFGSFNWVTSSTVQSGSVHSVIAVYNQFSDLYPYTSNTLSSNLTHTHTMGTEPAARCYVLLGDYLELKNTNDNNDLLIRRGRYNVYYPSYSFAYLSLKSMPAFAEIFLTTNTTTNEENKTYTLPRSPRHLLVISSYWGSTTSYDRTRANDAFAIMTLSNGDATGAYSLQKIGNYIHAYSSLNTVRLSGTYNPPDFVNNYIQHVSINGLTWSYKTRTDTANSAVPIFLLGLGETNFQLAVSSNSNKILSRRVHRLRTLFGSSTSDTLLSAANAARQILSVASESLSMLNRGLSKMLSTSSGHLSRLLKGFFAFLARSSSSTATLLTLPNKLLRVVSSFSVILRLPQAFSAVLAVVSESLATLVKRLFETLETDSEQTSQLEKTILIFLRAFSSWQAWIVLLIEKLLEVVSDTRNDLEREVTHLFRQWEQELHAVSTSLSEIFRTFFRELSAETYQWVRMERIRGPVFALRSWLWRVRRRKHGCS